MFFKLSHYGSKQASIASRIYTLWTCRTKLVMVVCTTGNRANNMAQKPSKIREFQKRFPDEDACLTHLMRNRFGERLTCFKCQKQATYYRVKARRSFECEHCGYQVYPTAGTPFEKTRTSLRDWFYVMFLFCETRNGVAAKEVLRQLGVTYKTAWRMCHLIRLYMGYVDGDTPIGGPARPLRPTKLS